MTEGPFFLDRMAVRRDITEGRPGTPLQLRLTVVDAGTCRPIPGAPVDVWHADARGEYSGFGGGGSGTTFLRGIQIAGDDGTVTFDTVYPGWYPGRAVHIHLKAHNGGNRVHTTQLFFDEDLTDEVYAASPYRGRSGSRTLNSQDSIYRNGGSRSTLAVSRDGDAYTGTLTLGIRDTG
jgi:protocatechuate 3,4-dioxygenase beta subunit